MEHDDLIKYSGAYKTVNEAVEPIIKRIDAISYKLDVDEVARSGDGTYILRKGYFYHPSADLGTWASNVIVQLKNLLGVEFVEVDRNDEFKKFIGGAPLKKQSHYWIKIKQKV
jgi:hypothetical protein